MKHPSLTGLLDSGEFPSLATKEDYEKMLERLQSRMLLIQQGIFHSKKRAIMAFEGFDAAGKGGSIRRLTEKLDPRGYRVIPVGPPTPDEQGRHWLYRFWRDLPLPGTIAIFDRSWYGRVLVERVEHFAEKEAWKRAYGEIREFERMLVADGIDLVKMFFAVSKEEQLRRFRGRLEDPHKQWKLGEPDIRARERWDDYVKATDQMFEKTDIPEARWHLVPGDRKWYARVQTLQIATGTLSQHGKWMQERMGELTDSRRLAKALRKLG